MGVGLVWDWRVVTLVEGKEMNEEETLLQEEDGAIIIRGDGYCEFLVPKNSSEAVDRCLNLLMKVLKTPELIEYISRYDNENDGEIWH
jgi:hypothetical protein